jgi:hypothetical protein
VLLTEKEIAANRVRTKEDIECEQRKKIIDLLESIRRNMPSTPKETSHFAVCFWLFLIFLVLYDILHILKAG